MSKTTIIGKNRAEVSVSVRSGVREAHFQCDNRRGILEAIGVIASGQLAQVTHPKCMHRGDRACHYLISWRARLSAIWKRAGTYASALALAVAAGTSFFLPVASWIPLILVMGVGCLSLLSVGHKLENKELVNYLKEKGDAANHLIEAINARYENARLVHEIGMAGADILEVNTFTNAILGSMSRNLNYNRGMIALFDNASKRLYCVDSYGFSTKAQQFLDKMNFNFDLADSSDGFAGVSKTGKPSVIRDIYEQTSTLTPNSRSVIEGLGVESLISVPLIHKEEPLGLLLVDTKGTNRDHTTDDVNLLLGIASQMATGIVNAQSFARMMVSERRYRLLAENVTDVIWILDLKTLKLTYVSPSVEKTLGYTPNEIMTLSIDGYLTPDALQEAVATLGGMMKRVSKGEVDTKNYSITIELEAVHKNRSIIPTEVTAGFLLDENDRPNSVLGISRDLSDRKRSERERTAVKDRLQQAKKMESLGTMAGSIAHNFKNLLMVVLGNLEIAKADLPEGSTAADNIQRAANASQRATDLSNLMLTYVGQLKKESLPVDLSQIVKAILKNLDESKMVNVNLEMELTDPMPLVAADTDQMRQVISGFITNAIEALGKAKGRVRISTGSMHCDKSCLSTTYLKEEMPEGMYAYVEVADTGCGMDAETLGKVFDPFFSTKFTGRGLGMAAVMGIIRSHNGAVKVSSVKNEGTVFTALFPIQGISLPPVAVDNSDDPTVAQGKTVLLVDDEAMVMDIGSQFLKRLGYNVLTASDGQQALDKFRQAMDRVDCVLLDFTMPGMNGLETMQQIKNIRPDTKIIIASGYVRQQIEDQFSTIGPPDDFIQKPFEMKALQKKLDAVISAPR